MTEWSLPHELGHQLGIIDYYNLDYHGSEGLPVTGRREPLRFSHFFSDPRVMMHWHGPHVFHELTAEYLNRTKGKPRGAYGDCTFQTPKSCALRILDANSRPVPGAKVTIYQRGTVPIADRRHTAPGNVTWWDVEEKNAFAPRFSFPPHPVIEGMTNADGTLELPNRSVEGLRALNGYERRPNPFGTSTRRAWKRPRPAGFSP